ncbi:MAG: glycoside hydrolase family 3 C-terminal domain-containing protein [Lachnospiraceae bacterium]|nr:glycoside hydrolase family 3 C-terminal domain-containing protein [Lachnospiraceae bacterium]
MERNVKKIVSQMTLEEKAGMCSGKDFWHLKSVERLGIPEVMVSDGPHGLRKQAENADHLGINESIKAVCFPTACATACSFDRDLLEEMGSALGKECQAENVSVLLGPAVNIKRSPLCGRNFEYFSEDPYLAGQMAKAHIQGVQKEGVGTSIKHFAANNQEYHRMSASSEVDERTLREIYLAAFETPIKEAKPKTVMCSYNQINGVFASEDPWLLDEVLRKEWGYEGYVMSDWGAVNERVPGLKAGLELEMPASGGETDRQIVEAVKNGTLKEEILDRAVERILNVIFDYVNHKKDEVFDMEKDHALAEKVETESMVLLKNEGILPLKKGSRVAFIGAFAKNPRYQGGGSSHINSFRVTGTLEAAEGMADITYAEGYGLEKDEIDEALVKGAVKAAKEAEVAVIFAGLPDAFESEGYDRVHMKMPNCQNHLIHEVCNVQPNVVVVLHNGSPVEMPWADEVKGILEAYLGGQAVGAAEAKILFGDANPCGKLAETIPYKLSDNPSYLNFPGDGETVEYKEGIFVGYRYYDKKEMPVRYPFGYGLSYTEFAYSNLKLDKKSMKDTDTLTVSVDVTNTGSREGKEIVQLYVADLTGSANRPVRELKNFVKVSLAPGETKTVQMELNKRSFAWYNVKLHDWYAASGTYEIQIGKSSREIVLSDTVEVTTDVTVPVEIHKNTTVGQLMRDPKAAAFLQETMGEMMKTLGGGGEASTEAISPEMIQGMLESMPLRGLRSFAGLSEEGLNQLVEKLRSL